MTPEFFRRMDEIFTAARGLPRGERTRYLESACGQDRALRTEVEALLEQDADPQAYLKTPAMSAGLQFTLAGSEAPRSINRLTPERIGGYRILRTLGEGGFGIVYLAEQENPRRTVALKVMKPHIASPQMLRRFEYEAQVLGRLAHPGIAQIFEAGTAEGGDCLRAFFAMEYVQGRPLDAYAREAGLDASAKLELAAKVCDAIQYAHQRGVIHRDLKPANILVVDPTGETGAAAGDADTPTAVAPLSAAELRARRPASRRTRRTAVGPRGSAIQYAQVQPKILDFGVARSTDPDVQYTSLQTSAGQLIGTLPYMSPEQVAGDPAEVDTRADVYALGVVLYQVLSGKLPYDFRNCSIAEAARRIRDDEPPRLGGLDRALRGEIEVIVAKAMDKDKSRRYQTAGDLAADLRRHLNGEPIEARRNSTLYVIGKSLRRHRKAAIAAAVFLLLLSTFAVVSSVQSRRNWRLALSCDAARMEADVARRRAESLKRKADDTSARLAVELGAANIERGRLFGLTGNLSAAEDALWSEHFCAPDSPFTHWALWELYSRAPSLAAIGAHHGGDIVAGAFDPRGRFFASAGADGEIVLREPRAFAALRTLAGLTAPVTALAWSPDGAVLIAALADGDVAAWECPGFSVLPPLCGLGGRIASASFAPDGRLYAAVGSTVLICSVADAAVVGRLDDFGAGVTRLDVNPVNGLVAVGLNDGTLALALDQTTLARFPAHENAVTPVNFSPDGDTLVTGAFDRRIRRWSLDRWGESRTLRSNNGALRAFAFTSDGRTMISSGWWQIDAWDMDAERRTHTYPLGGGAVFAVVSPDGKLFASGSRGELRVWEISTQAALRRFPMHEGRSAARFSPDGRILATADGAGRVFLWDFPSGELRRELVGHRARVRTLAFHPRRRILATGSEDRTLRLWNLDTGECVRTFSNHNDETAWAVDFSPDGRLMASCMTNRRFQVRNFRTGDDVDNTFDAGSALGVRFSPDGQRIATTSRGNVLRLWRLNPPASVQDLDAGATWWTAAFSADGRRLAAGGWSRNVDVWDLDTGRRIASCEGHTGLIGEVAFRPGDPDVVVSAGAEGSVRLWHAPTGRCLATLEAFDGWDALTVSFTPDGRFLASSSAVGDVVVWDLNYYDTHIAANAAQQLARLRPRLGDRVDDAAVTRWLERIGRSSGGPYAAALTSTGPQR